MPHLFLRFNPEAPGQNRNIRSSVLWTDMVLLDLRLIDATREHAPPIQRVRGSVINNDADLFYTQC